MLGNDASRQNIKALHETRAMRQSEPVICPPPLYFRKTVLAREGEEGGGGALQAKKGSMIYYTQHLIFLDC